MKALSKAKRSIIIICLIRYPNVVVVIIQAAACCVLLRKINNMAGKLKTMQCKRNVCKIAELPENESEFLLLQYLCVM